MGVCGSDGDLFLCENNVINSSHISGGWEGGTAVPPAQNQGSGTRDVGSACSMTLPGTSHTTSYAAWPHFPSPKKEGLGLNDPPLQFKGSFVHC